MKVLDKGFIELVDHMGSDLTVVNAARVSYGNSSSQLGDKDIKLIKYLASHGHKSPFYHPQLSFRVKCPISVRDQWFKHKIGTAENCASSRYSEMEPEFYVPERLHPQAKSNKQGRDYEDCLNDEYELLNIYKDTCGAAFNNYKLLIANGVAKEQAREILPLCTYTSFIWSASLMAVVHFVNLRSTQAAQFEIRQYAEAMKVLTQERFPVSLEALLHAV